MQHGMIMKAFVKTISEYRESITSALDFVDERGLRNMTRRYFDVGITVFLISFLALSSGCSDSKAKQPAQRVVPVKVGSVTQQNVPIQIGAIGNVEAYNTVSVRALVNGEVIDVHFKEGQDVRRGDLLFQIDPRPYDAALKQSEAQLARDAAQAKLAEEQAKRYEILIKKDYVSKDQYDTFRANAEATAALVNADRANVDNNRLQLAYCTIKSPINGRLGTVLVNVGNVIKANDVPMVTINQVTPIYVTFAVPEQNLANIKKFMAMGSLKVDAIIPGDEKRPAQGRLTFIDNAVDTTTGTIKVKGTFENNDRRLWPGQFINVVLTLTTQPNAVVIPISALQAGQAGQYVFVVKSDSTAESRPVTITRLYGDLAVVTQGVQPGEQVVTDGQMQLISGTRVEIKGGEVPTAPMKNDQAQNGKEAPGKSK
jgi:membrane fusion protein, multidrug efflux system